MHLVDGAAGVAQAHDRGSRCRQIGVAHTVARGHPIGHFPLLVVVLQFGGRNSNDVGVVRRCAQVARGPPVVTGGGHHHDARLPSPLDGRIERIGAVGQGGAAVERQVEYPNVERASMTGDPIDPSDHLSHIDGTGAVAHFHRHDAGIRGNTEEPVGVQGCGGWIGAGIFAGDDARHVGAMAIRVDIGAARVARLCGEVDCGDDLAGARQRRHRCDTGIDDGHVHPPPGEALGPQGPRTHLIDHVVQRAVGEGHSGGRPTGGRNGESGGTGRSSGRSRHHQTGRQRARNCDGSKRCPLLPHPARC